MCRDFLNGKPNGKPPYETMLFLCDEYMLFVNLFTALRYKKCVFF